MKYLLLLVVPFITYSFCPGQGNVGIGTNTPKAFLNVPDGKTVLFGSDSSGFGSKLVWYGKKGAFRAGYGFGSAGYDFDNSWDLANVGTFSAAFGSGTIAKGSASLALGEGTIASGQNSVAMGRYNVDVPSALLMIGYGYDDYGSIYRSNVFTVLSDGRVGIGTSNPGALLDIAGQIKITGGAPAAGKVLTSDANGLASWKSLSCNLSIGDVYQGGYIFYLDPSGCHGLIADLTDLGVFSWGTNTSLSKHAYADWVFQGSINTNLVVSLNGSNVPAAYACYTSAKQGYTDWYLPSKTELNMMYMNLHVNGIGGFITSTQNNAHIYWSSTEGVGGNWALVMINGSMVTNLSSQASSVRAIRSF